MCSLQLDPQMLYECVRLYVSRHVMEGRLHDYLSVKPQNKLLLMPAGYLRTLLLLKETSIRERGKGRIKEVISGRKGKTEQRQTF